MKIASSHVSVKTRLAGHRGRLWGPEHSTQLDQPWAVDELDGVFGGELLGGERERARRDEEAFVAASVMDRSQEFLKDGRADHRLPLILALNDGNEPIIAAKAKVGPFVAGAADLLDLEAQHFEELADEFLERLGGERRELGQLEIGAAGHVDLSLQPFASVANRLAQVAHFVFVASGLGCFGRAAGNDRS